MKVFRSLKLAVIGFAVAGCDSSNTLGPPPDLEYAAATNTCGPLGESAVEIFLVPAPMQSLAPQTPYARMSVVQPLKNLEGRTWQLAGPDAEGGAWYHPTANDIEIATWGVLTVTSVTADSTIEGNVHLVFPSGRNVSGEFRATWFNTNRLCL